MSVLTVGHGCQGMSATRWLDLSDERDLWLRRLLAAEQTAYERGRVDGIREGREIEGAERDAAWNRIAGDAVRLCLSPDHAEMEQRRWGPAGREHFGDPRDGDFPGRGEAA